MDRDNLSIILKEIEEIISEIETGNVRAKYSNFAKAVLIAPRGSRAQIHYKI
jgi:hypothetical protein